MNDKKLQLVVQYAAAVAAIGVATWLRELADPMLGQRVPFVTYFFAVVVLALYGGPGPALLATALGSLAALYFFIDPSNSLTPADSSGWVAWALFVFVGGATSLLSQSRRWALARIASQQETIREEALRFNVTLMNIGDGVIMVDTAGQVTYMNSVAEQLTGWKLAEAQDQPIEQVYQTVNDRTRSETVNPAREVLTQQAAIALPNFPVLIATDSTELPVNDHAVPLLADDGAIRGAVLLFRDDTQRRKARKALRASETRFRTLADSAPVLIWMVDTQGKVTFVNQPRLDFTGRSKAEELSGGWGMGIYEEDIDRCLEVFRENFQSRQDFQLEYRLLRSDGEYRWILDHGIPLYDSDGEFTGYIGSCIDITRQREAVDALRESEERFRALANNAPAAIFIKDLQGRYLLANPLTSELLGGGNVLGQTDHEHLPAPIADQLHKHDLQVLQSKEPLETEEDVSNGTQRKMFLSVKFPLHNAQGELSGVGGVSVDITDRKQAEKALRESEETFHGMSDSIPQLAWMARPDGHIFWYNQRWYDFTGTNFEEMEGWGWQAVHDPEHLPRVLQTFTNAITNGVPWEHTFPLRRHDGAMRWHLSRMLPVRNQAGEILRWFGTNTDITDRKQVESTLRFLAQASESLSTLVDSRQTMQAVARHAVPAFADWCEVAIADGDQFNHFSVLHDQWRESFGATLEQSRRPQPTDDFGLGAIFQSQQAELLTGMTRPMREALARDDQHLEFMQQVGLDSLLSIPFSVHGQMLGVISFARTAPDRPFTSDDLALAEDLAHRAGVAIENARLYQELRETDRRKDDFLAMLAHELRNPLAPIRSGLELLALQATADAKLLGSMQKQVEHLVRLVDDLLDVSRIMRGKVELRRQKVPLRELIEQVLHASQPLIRQQRHDLVLTLTDDDVWLDADPVRLIQVFENLITNACKYTEPRGTLELITSLEGAQATITVRDNGQGIDRELLPKVFDLFTQATRTLDRSQGGLGIGLTLVRNLVDMHGGSVSVRSEGIGKGSEFVVRLPTCKAEQKTPIETPQSNAARRLLLVDDNQAAADILRLLVLQLGPHEATAVYSGEQALEKLKHYNPDIILLDIGLPGMNGYQVAQQIRSTPQYDHMLLVALTGYGQEEDRRKSREAGFDVHLVKPPAMDEIEKLFSHPKVISAEHVQAERESTDSTVLDSAGHFAESHSTNNMTNEEEASQSIHEIMHDLGNTAHVVTMAASILEKSSDPADQEAVPRMLKAAREAMISTIESLKAHASGEVRQL